MQNKAAQKGFTLIELLIVISIIGILTGVLIPIINANQFLKEARDATRVKDILNLQTAIIGAVTVGDITLTDTSTCTTCTSLSGTSLVNGTGWVSFQNNGSGLANFTPTLPEDPKNKDGLMFSYHSNGISFEINTTMESDRYSEYSQKDGGNDPNVYERGWDLTIN